MGSSNTKCTGSTSLCKACIGGVKTRTKLIIKQDHILLSRSCLSVEQKVHADIEIKDDTLELHIDMGAYKVYDYVIRRLFTDLSEIVEHYKKRHQIRVFLFYRRGANDYIYNTKIDCLGEGITRTYNMSKVFLMRYGYKFSKDTVSGILIPYINEYRNLRFTNTLGSFSITDGKTNVIIRPNGACVYIDSIDGPPSGDLEDVVNQVRAKIWQGGVYGYFSDPDVNLITSSAYN